MSEIKKYKMPITLSNGMTGQEAVDQLELLDQVAKDILILLETSSTNLLKYTSVVNKLRESLIKAGYTPPW